MSDKSYSYHTAPTGQESLLIITEKVIEEFNHHVELEKTRRNTAIELVKNSSSIWQKLLEDESEKKITDLYEKLQQTLEDINNNLSVLEISEEELQKVKSIIDAFGVKPKGDGDTVEGGEKN